MNPQRLYGILKRPHVTEKVTRLGMRSNQYCFVVAKDATKKEVQNAVEQIFDVVVDNVTTVNVKGKPVSRALRRLPSGNRKNWKKAYVRLREGERIDLTKEIR
ncbi:MAG: 50S ribosomal protein L23 [Gammaproteobacteria bacterium]|nr:50S ribosomal protein L23 [Gammaproteobacteria bacterium]MYF37995.1 50S ribosomal protein L23 [Gammaproteobacteria bacterium]